MKLPRRQFLHLTAGATALSAVSRMARAQAYPSRPVRIIVGFAAGGTTDAVARLVGQWLSQRLGQQFIIENRPGGNANIATEAVARAPADGHMLIMISSTNTINATLYDKLNFNFTRDIAPIATIIRVPLVLVVNPSVPAKTVPELIAYARANPGKVSMASPGSGTPAGLSVEQFKLMAGIDLVHVPYRGDAPALTDLLGGQVQALFTALPTSIEHIRAGKLRALAVTTAARLEVLPDIPALSELVPAFEASFWLGLGAPKNMPADIIAMLNREINAGLANASIEARLGELGGTVLASSPADFGKLIADDTEKWAKVIRAANVKPQ